MLESLPTQTKIEFDKFAELVYELTLASRVHLLKKNKTKFCGEPIIKWFEIMQTLIAAGSDHLTNQLDLP